MACDNSICMASTALGTKVVYFIVLFEEIKHTHSVLGPIDVGQYIESVAVLGNISSQWLFTFTILITETNK